MATTATNTKLSKLQAQLAKALKEKYEAESDIKKQGTHIIIPEHMSYRDAAEALVDHEKQQSETVEQRIDFQCHPDDGYVNLYRALSEVFGNVIGASVVYSGFFGEFKIPGRQITVAISASENISVPFGEIKIPGLPIKITTYANPNADSLSESNFFIILEFQRMYQPLVNEIEKAIRYKLENESIFRGKAINSKFEFLDLSQFDINRVIYGEEEASINASIFTPIKHPDVVTKAGVPLKRTVLLYGGYGTGKTLTALSAAKICEDNKWTFINVAPGDSIVDALRFARRYEPCVVFFEDVDSATKNERGRTDDINSILNTIDGLLSKDDKIITILTTNHIDSITRAMMRPGRIDEKIEMGVLNSSAVSRFVRVYGGDMLVGDIDETELWKYAEGFPPAFVVEAVHKSKLYAIAAGRVDNGGVMIVMEDVVQALKNLRPQYDMMMAQEIKTQPSISDAMRELVAKEVIEAISNTVPDIVAEVLDDKL